VKCAAAGRSRGALAETVVAVPEVSVHLVLLSSGMLAFTDAGECASTARRRGGLIEVKLRLNESLGELLMTIRGALQDARRTRSGHQRHELSQCGSVRTRLAAAASWSGYGLRAPV
jgi:hypothetical protein